MKVLIVDDEMVIRLGLKSLIDWESNGFKLVGEASDGSKALELINKYQPDIVITDIKMPVMDGIELIRETRKLSHPPHIIVLSSYNDFQLVREAMKYGAEEYILKLEMEPESLLKVLAEMRKKVEEAGQRTEQRLQVDTQIRKNLPVLRGKLLKDIVLNHYLAEKEYSEAAEFLDIRLDTTKICCMALKIEELYRFEVMEERDVELLNFSIVNIAEEIINDRFIGYCIDVKAGEFCIILSPKENPEARTEDAASMEITALRLIEMLRKYLNLHVAVGIGRWEPGIRGMHESYRQASGALEMRFLKPDSRIFFWKDTAGLPPSTRNEYSILSFKNRLHQALEFHQENELEMCFQAISNEVSRMALDRETACRVSIEVIYMISELFEKYQLPVKEVLKTSYLNHKQLLYIESAVQVKEWVLRVKSDLTEYVKKENEADYPRVIAKAKRYIEEYSGQDISLKEVADTVNLNPSYFSTLFMQQTGVSYTDYITRVRIDKAKVLLKETDLKIYEISKTVGYQNVTYFNRTFKKVTGVTPVEYKNKLVKA